MIKPQVPPGPGTIVEYLQDNQVHLAVVIEEQSGRVRLFTQRGREMLLPAARLLPWHGPKYSHPATRSEMEERLARHLEQRTELARTIEVMDIWNLAQGEMSSAPLKWFAELTWDSPNHDQLSAMGRVLLDAKTHFKFQPPSFLIYPEQTVQSRLAEQEAVREHQELVVAGQDFFSQLWKTGNTDGCPPEPAAGRLKDLLLRRISNPEDASRDELWRNLIKKLPEHPQQALILAQAWGLVPAHYNHLLDQAGYDWQDTWARAHDLEIRNLSETVRARIGSFEPLHLFSVDSETTQDIDDAFALERTADGGFHLTLAIACPALEWPWGSELDAAIAQRASSLYLPEGVCHMLPEELGIGLFSLRENEPRPALLLEFELDSEAQVKSLQPRLGWVQIWSNTHYDQVEQDIQEGREPFAAAHVLAAMLRDRRIRQGAVVFDQPDPHLKLTGEDANLLVLLECKPPAHKAQLVVSEFMVLANAELARWACANNLPLLFRTQNVALPPGTGGHYTQPEDMYRMARMLANATLQTKPVLHASLGVQAYASVTSPLRRYVDFLNLGQVAAWIQSGSGRLGKADLEAGLPMWRSRLEAVGRVQRYRMRYWKLEYLRLQGPQKYWSAVLVDETPAQAVFSLPTEQVMVRAPKRLLRDKFSIGGSYLLRLSRVDPLLNEIKVVEVIENQTY